MIINNVKDIDKNTNVEGASYVGRPLSNTVMYATKKVERLLNNLTSVSGCVVFIEDTVDVPEAVNLNNTFIKSPMPQKDYANYVQGIFKKRVEDEKKLKIELSQDGYYISETARVGKDAVIEPGAFIGHGVVIGDNALIKAGAIIKNTTAGDNLVVCENATIGTTGFTMANDDKGNKMRIPTLGRVVIGNDVEIGALSNVSCGSAGNTVLKDYVKLDSLVHIGHDVNVGINVEFPAGAIIGGFVEIGDNAYVSINTTVRNRIKIGEGAFVGMGAVVTKSVEEGTIVVGNPAKPFVKKK